MSLTNMEKIAACPETVTKLREIVQSWAHGGSAGDFSRKDRERFMAKAYPEPNSGCWLWDGILRSRAGYGAFQIGRKLRASHRLSYEMHVGAMPNGMCICHHCDVPGCVNPAHPFVGTNAENVADKIAKGRHGCAPRISKIRFARGERHPGSKVSESTVREIRREYATGTITQWGLARKHGLRQAAVSLIVRRVTWSHLEDGESC